MAGVPLLGRLQEKQTMPLASKKPPLPSEGILQAARHFVRSDKLTEGLSNRVDTVICALDPCLSCSNHPHVHIPLHLRLVSPDGKLLDELRRSP